MGQATHAIVNSPASNAVGVPFQFTVLALDVNNFTDINYRGKVSFTSTDTAAVLPPQSILANLGAGLFSATLKTLGNQTITAILYPFYSSPTSTVTTGGGSFINSFSVASPSTYTAGVGFPFTVTALDQNHNPFTAYSGTVDTTSTDTAATLQGPHTLSAGVGVFSATLHTPSQATTLTVTDSAVSSATGNSGAIAVVGPTTHLAVAAPSTDTVSVGFGFVVTARDSANNTTPNYTGTVHFTSNDTGATLPANHTLTNGVGNFSATLVTIQTTTLTATDATTVSVTGHSGAIVVSAVAEAVFIKSDTTTQGNWSGPYGNEGYDIAGGTGNGGPGDFVDFPAWASVSINNTSARFWETSYSNAQDLEIPSGGGNRIAAAWYNQSNFNVTIDITDGETHAVALYLLDWNSQGRAETIVVTDTATGNVLNTQSAINFVDGVYFQWNLTSNVTITITSTTGATGVLSGLFFDAAAIPLQVTAPATQTAGSGILTSFGFAFTDYAPGDAPWAISVNWGDSSTTTASYAAPGAVYQNHSYASNGTFTATLKVTNNQSVSVSASSTITTSTPSVPVDYTASSITPYILSNPVFTYSVFTVPNFGAIPTVKSIANGNWTATGTWNTGVVPTTGDIVSIEPNTTVTYNSTNTASIGTVIIQNAGNLVWATNANTSLTVQQIMVMGDPTNLTPGGLLQIGTSASPISSSVTAKIIFPNIALNLTADPGSYGNGLFAFGGSVTMYGMAKTPTWIVLGAEAHAGDTTLTLGSTVTGWEPGDLLILPNTAMTDPNGDNAGDYEVLTVSSVSGTTLHLTTALAYDHLGAHDGNGTLRYLGHVGNMTRNVIIESANPAGVRGHTFFTGRTSVNIQNTAFIALGRTDNSVGDIFGSANNANPANVFFRYPVFFNHLVGPYAPQANGYQYTFVNNSIYDLANNANGLTIRWPITVLISGYGLIQGNVMFNWAGADIIFQFASEIDNVCDSNFMVAVSGNGARASDDGPDIGREGSGIFCSGALNYITNNVVANVGTPGFAYGYIYLLGGANIPLYQGADPLVSGQYAVVNMQDTPLLEFSGNMAYSQGYGMTIWFLGALFATCDPDIATSTIEDFVCWNVGGGFFSYCMSNVVIDGYVFLGDFTKLGADGATTAYVLSDYLSPNVIFQNCDIEGANKGIIHQAHVGSVAQFGSTPVPFTIKNSTMWNLVNFYVSGMYSTDGGGAALSARSNIVNNVLFKPINDAVGLPGSLGTVIQQNVTTFFDSTLQQQPDYNWYAVDQILIYNYNQVPGANYQLYYYQQAATAIMPQTQANGVGCPVAGLTNAQALAQYQVCSFGAITPGSAVDGTSIGLIGMVISM